MAAGTVGAVLDVGSNTVLLLVAAADDGRLRVVDEALATTRLGSGLVDGRPLDPAACARTREAVTALADRARAAGASRPWIVATAAARRASDGRAFVARLGVDAGCDAEVLSGEREAHLAYAAVVDGLRLAGPVLAVDVGGGTTELTRGDGPTIAAAVSLPLGALRLTEAHVRADPPGAGAAAAIRDAVARALATTSLPADAAGATCVASGGSATALATLDLALPRWDPARVHGHVLAADRLAALAAWLVATPTDAVRAHAALDPDRARILAAGALVLDGLVRAAGAPALRVSDHGIRHAYLRARLAAAGSEAAWG